MEQTINKQQILKAVRNIPLIAEKEKWAITLDREEGSLYYAPEIIPVGSQLHQITDEYALYLDASQNPQGVVVDYYRTNFLKHHKSFSEISSEVFEENKEEDRGVVTLNSEELKENRSATIFRSLLEAMLIKEVGINSVQI